MLTVLLPFINDSQRFNSYYPTLSPSTLYIISTIVGTGTCSFSGDSGAATSAALNYPYGVALDSSGWALIKCYIIVYLFNRFFAL